MKKPGQWIWFIETRTAGSDKCKENKVKIANADMVEVIAWENGFFRFESADIETIVREIDRWYNLEIVYTGKVARRRFQGKVNGNAGLSDVLRIL